MSRTYGVAVIGAGYWGPNLVRNFPWNHAADLGPGLRSATSGRETCPQGRRPKVPPPWGSNDVSSNVLLARRETSTPLAIATPPRRPTHQLAFSPPSRRANMSLGGKPLAPTSVEAGWDGWTRAAGCVRD